MNGGDEYIRNVLFRIAETLDRIEAHLAPAPKKPRKAPEPPPWAVDLACAFAAATDVSPDKVALTKWADAVDKMHRIDGMTPRQIGEMLTFIAHDTPDKQPNGSRWDGWRGKANPVTLRQRGPDGVTKREKVLKAMRSAPKRANPRAAIERTQREAAQRRGEAPPSEVDDLAKQIHLADMELIAARTARASGLHGASRRCAQAEARALQLRNQLARAARG